LILHQADDFGRNAGGGPAPSRMHGRDHFVFGIHHKYRRAIRRFDADGQIGAVGHDGVIIQPFARSKILTPRRDNQNAVPVHLVEHQEIFHRDAERAGQFIPVLQHMKFFVAFPEAHIEALVVILRNASLTGAESVRQKITGRETRRLQIGDAVFVQP